jgi:DNA repair protein RecO (recombination protein O)
MRGAETTEAILLRRSRFGESGRLLVWLAPRHGKVRTATRGSPRKGAGPQAAPDLFQHAEIQFVPARSGDLHSLRETRLLAAWPGLRSDYGRLLAASYFAEVCDLLSEPGHGTPELFDLLRRALAHLDAHPPTARAVAFFESEACRALGLGHEDNALGAIEAHGGRIPSNRRLLASLFSPGG